MLIFNEPDPKVFGL